MHNKISTGLIGCGRWGKNILRDLVSLGVEVHVAEHGEKNRQDALAAGASSVANDWHALPDTVDGYVVAVQTDRHYETLGELAATSRPVFVEKPVAPSLTQAQELADLMGERLFVMHKWRYHPGIQMFADLVQSGTYGKLQRLVTRRLQWGHPHNDVDAVWILAPHDLSIALHILGQLPELITARGTVSGNSIHDMSAIFGRMPSASIEVSGISPVNRRLVMAIFERAIVSLTDPLADHLEVHLRDAAGEPTDRTDTIEISTEYPLLRELRSFTDYLRGGPEPMSPVRDELQIMERLDQARKLILQQ